MIDLVFKNYTRQRTLGQSFLKKVLEIAVKETEKLRNTENKKLRDLGISVNLVGEARIKDLNQKYRNKNKPTNVLAFPMPRQGDALTWRARQGVALTLGDIFLCLSIAKKEAKRENISIREKLAQLTVHGVLHLLGYDHEKSKASARAMLRLENKILDKIKV